MHITFVDDSIAFDGFTASSRALGGAEKAFASLPGALARRGHTVAVFNRCRWSMYTEGAQWETLDGKRPLATDALVAFRRPSLLEFIRQARVRVLWTTQPATVLDRKANRDQLEHFKPHVLLTSQAQGAGWSAPKGLRVGYMPAAIRSDYTSESAVIPASPPRAVVTTHPDHGMDWLLSLWLDRIQPAVPGAELHLYSMGLSKALNGGEVEPRLQDMATRIAAAANQGIRVQRPSGDSVMAQVYREARVHLYPGHADDTTAFTLMESQATGLPAVLRPLGAGPERVLNGHSAYVVPDDDAFANLATLLLSNEDTARSMGAEARALYQGRTWDAAAEQFEAWLA